MSERFVAPAHALRGAVAVPGDKSISQRALLIAALGEQPVQLSGLNTGTDVQHAIAAIRALGAQVTPKGGVSAGNAFDAVEVTGSGMTLGDHVDVELSIQCGNSGTLARLLCGILAGQRVSVTLHGDQSLRRRPMRRVVDPLRRMGVQFPGVEEGSEARLPLTLRGSGDLQGIEYALPVASAQVQGCLLLAGMWADRPSILTEPAAMRDHTERLLRRAGVEVRRRGRAVAVSPVSRVQLPDTRIPGDPSAAAPLALAATLLHESLLHIEGVCVNPTRTAFLSVLDRMGARASTGHRAMTDGEAVADIEVLSAPLRSTRIRRDEVPLLMDELPLIALAAHFCRGETKVRGAGELRVKESDRIKAIVRSLRAIGIACDELEDGFVVRGSGARPNGGEIDSEGDHRIAMLGAVAGLVSRRGVTVYGSECVESSFPGFFEVLESLATRGDG